MSNNLKQYLARVTHSLEAGSLEWVSRRVRIDSTEHDAVECVTSRSPLCLLGDPGSGKTTVLKMATLSVSQSSQGTRVVPFFISAAAAPDVHIVAALSRSRRQQQRRAATGPLMGAAGLG